MAVQHAYEKEKSCHECKASLNLNTMGGQHFHMSFCITHWEEYKKKNSGNCHSCSAARWFCTC